MSNNANIFEVRLKNNGRLFSRHYEAKTPEQAAMRAKGKGIIQSVRKVHPSDIIGTIASMNLEGIIGIKTERRQSDVILNGTTLDNIIFPMFANKPSSNSRKRFKDKYKQKNQQEV